MGESDATRTWPTFFPEDVPPHTAAAASGVAFRLVDSNPPTAPDFKSTFEEYPNRRFGGELWKACAASLYTQRSDSDRTRRRYKKLRNKMIASGELHAGLGVMLATPSSGSGSHLSVWFYREAQPHLEFRVLER